MTWYSPPTPNFFSLDFGNSHDPIRLGLRGHVPTCGYATGAMEIYQEDMMQEIFGTIIQKCLVVHNKISLSQVYVTTINTHRS